MNSMNCPNCGRQVKYKEDDGRWDDGTMGRWGAQSEVSEVFQPFSLATPRGERSGFPGWKQLSKVRLFVAGRFDQGPANQ